MLFYNMRQLLRTVKIVMEVDETVTTGGIKEIITGKRNQIYSV